MSRLSKNDHRLTIVLSTDRLSLAYNELYKRARAYAKARDEAERHGATQTAIRYQETAQALYSLAHQIWPGLTSHDLLPLPEEDWREIRREE